MVAPIKEIAGGDSAAVPARPSAEAPIIGDILHMSGGNFLRQISGLVTTFLRAKLLPPELLGVWSLLRIVLTYASYLHLGGRSTLRYVMPLHLDRNDAEAAGTLAGSVLRGTLVLTLLPVVGLSAAAALWPDWSPEVRVSVGMMAAVLLANGLFEHAVGELKGRRRFSLIGAAFAVHAVLMLIFTAGLTWAWGLAGTVAAAGISAIGAMYFLRRVGRVQLADHPFDRQVYKAALRTGAPTLGFDAALMGLRSIDRLIVAALLSAQHLGFYALGAMAVGYLMNIPGVSREVLESRLFGELEAAQTPAAKAAVLHRHVMRPLMIGAVTMSFLCGIVVLMTEPLILLTLPAYAPSVLPVQILAAGSFFLALSYPLRGILVAYKKQMAATVVVLVGAAVMAGAVVLLVNAGLGNAGAALGATAGYVVTFGLLVVVVLRMLGPDRPPALAALFMVGGCFAGMIGMLALSDMVGRAVSPHPVLGALAALGVYGIYLALLGGLAWRLDLVPARLRAKARRG